MKVVQSTLPALTLDKTWDTHSMKTLLRTIGALIFCIGSYGCPPTTTKPLAQTEFDLSTLASKNIDEVQTMLGIPAIDSAPDPVSGQTSSAKVWKKLNASLIADYDSSSRRVRFFYMSIGTSDRYSWGQIWRR
ncbi:hypothetical protein IAD21_01996 [Abditibacteriota bacterium]|nr:hypothetical protein IAD21_01996 [Abditibacteriota bacterium]